MSSGCRSQACSFRPNILFLNSTTESVGIIAQEFEGNPKYDFELGPGKEHRVLTPETNWWNAYSKSLGRRLNLKRSIIQNSDGRFLQITIVSPEDPPTCSTEIKAVKTSLANVVTEPQAVKVKKKKRILRRSLAFTERTSRTAAAL